MKAKWFDEVAVILQSEAFHQWLERLEKSRKTLRLLRERHEEVLTQVNLLEFRAEVAHRRAIDTLERANRLDDESIALSNESAEIENASFEEVSQFEMQRAKCTDLWGRLGAVEVEIEEASGDVGRLSRQREKLAREYEREAERKQELWVEVEALWVRSIDRSLALHEKRHKAKIVRAEAETYFQKQSNESQQAEALRSEAQSLASQLVGAEEEVTACCAEAREKYECLLHEDFLYWSAREDNKMVYATPLLHDATNYAVELRPGAVYQCPHQQGLDELVELELEDEAADGSTAADAGDAEPDTAGETDEADETAAEETAAQSAADALDALGGEGSHFSLPLEERPTRLLDVHDHPGDALVADDLQKSEDSGEGASDDSEDRAEESEASASTEDRAEESEASASTEDSTDESEASASTEDSAEESESSASTEDSAEESEASASTEDRAEESEASASTEDSTEDSAASTSTEVSSESAEEPAFAGDGAPSSEESSSSDNSGEAAEIADDTRDTESSEKNDAEDSGRNPPEDAGSEAVASIDSKSPEAAEGTGEQPTTDSASAAEEEAKQDDTAASIESTSEPEDSPPSTADAEDNSNSKRSRKNKLRGGRRRGKRHRRTQLEIRTELIFDDRTISTTTHNIAAGGISFNWSERLDVGETLEARCYIPLEDSFDPLKIRSEVVWVDAVGDDWKVGIAFREFEADGEDLLKKWLLERIRAEKASA